MYLSKVVLDRGNKSVMQSLRNIQDMHRNLMRFFDDKREDISLLYRLYLKNTTAVIYMISKVMPDVLYKKKGIVLSGTKDISDWIKGFRNDQLFSFDLLASPSKKKSIEKGKNSRRRFILDENDRKKWLVEKLNNSGADLVSLIECGDDSLYGKHDSINGGNFYIKYTNFRGVLKITDADKFRDIYCNGIGPGKAYGLGMFLMVRQPYEE